MALEMKCICPNADLRNMVSSEYPSFTLAEAAAVVSGYSPCCTHWRTNKEFRYHCTDPCDVMNLWEQALRRALAGGELKSVRNRLVPTERLILRSDLEAWMEQHRREEALDENEENNPDSLQTQRAQAIVKAIKDKRWKSNSITVPEKTLLRKEVKDQFPKLYFTKSTFDKAWVEGGHLGLFMIKDREKYAKTQRPPREDRPKKS